MSVGPAEGPHFHPVDLDRMSRIPEIAKDPSEVPLPQVRKTPARIQYFLEAQEVISTLADGTEYLYWTYGRTVPGPMLRARVGDTIELTLKNHPTSTHDHSIDLHAVTGPAAGGATRTGRG